MTATASRSVSTLTARCRFGRPARNLPAYGCAQKFVLLAVDRSAENGALLRDESSEMAFRSPDSRIDELVIESFCGALRRDGAMVSWIMMDDERVLIQAERRRKPSNMVVVQGVGETDVTYKRFEYQL